jgi:serine/threonine-protein kinase HipA
MAGTRFLNVFFNAERVGSLYDTSPLAFEYASSWLARSDSFQIPTIALTPERQSSIYVQAFFENLLPEGELRDYIAGQKHASTLFSLLQGKAGDTAGAFVLLPPKITPGAPSYTATSWQKIAETLGGKSAAAIDLNGADTRISLAGAQDKASIAIFSDGVPQLPQGSAPSTHILKPDIKRLEKIWESAANEAIVMTTAANCGLPTAEVFYEPNTHACVVKRFDRFVTPDGTLGRLIQYDLCQLSGVLSDKKYEKEGGPGIAQCAALIRRYSSQSAVDLRHFAQWILFNIYVGNNDSHAKNLSLYQVPGKGLILTPFYDLMCTRLYPGLAADFAFSIGGETQPGKITREHLTASARELGMQPRFLLALAADLAARIPGATRMAVESTLPTLHQSARALSERLEQFILKTTKKTAARLAAPAHSSARKPD